MKPLEDPNKESYQRVCAETLVLPQNASWEEINRMRDSILNAFNTGMEQSKGGYCQADLVRYKQLEKERLMWIGKLGLDLNSTHTETDKFRELAEFAKTAEGRRIGLAETFRLDLDATWDEIHNVFRHLQKISTEKTETADQIRTKLCKAIRLPESCYDYMKRDIELGLEIDAYHYLQERKQEPEAA